MNITPITFLVVCPLLFLAGFVDAIGGGGGLISLPAYLLAGLPMHQAIATNKLSSACGTTLATARFVKEGLVNWKLAVPTVAAAMLGSSIGANRRGAVSGYVKTMFHAAYRREVFERVGRFNEALIRTEDNEMHYRIRRAGYRLFCTSDIVSYQYVRPSFRAMIKQKYANGSWVGTTLWVCPLCLSPYHLAPLTFLFAIMVTSVLAAFGLWQLSAIMWSAYLVLCLLAMLSSVVRRTATVWTPLLPLMFLTLHVAYGVGTLRGLFRKI